MKPNPRFMSDAAERLRFSGSPTQLTKEACSRRVRSKRLLATGLIELVPRTKGIAEPHESGFVYFGSNIEWIIWKVVPRENDCSIAIDTQMTAYFRLGV